MTNYQLGENCIVGTNVHIGANVIIEDNVTIGDDSYIDSNTIIRANVKLGKNAFVGSNCIIGEYMMDFCQDKKEHAHILSIGDDALIRSGSIIYAGSDIGSNFQTGHQVTIREKSVIGNHVSVGTLSDIQGNCNIGNYVRLHSNVHIGQMSKIDDYVWIFPYVVLTNDPTPPSDELLGVHVHSFAVIATSAVVLPGVDIAADTLVAAGAIVTKNVSRYSVVGGNPAKCISDIRNIKNKTTGENVYPWRYHFDRTMPWENIGYENWLIEQNGGGIASTNNNDSDSTLWNAQCVA